MPQFRIQHVTRYIYEDTVRDSANQIMLYPLDDDYQSVVQQTLTITGNPVVNVHDDYYGNKVGTFTYAQPHREMVIHSQVTVDTIEKELPTDDVAQDVQWIELKKLRNDISLMDFCQIERFSSIAEVEKIVSEALENKRSVLETAKHFNKYVYDTFIYKKGITTVETTLSEIWTLKSGVCQDFAHFLLAILRLVGLPSRYVSGYICPNKPGMRGEGATHAWVEAYLPFYGWLGLDPTNDCIVNEQHVKLAVGKNFSDCSPVKGTYRGTSNHILEVGVSVTYEDGKRRGETTGDDADPQIETTSTQVTSTYQNSFRKHQEMQMQQ
jgi:transglutaminase-like putative cysteine protease